MCTQSFPLPEWAERLSDGNYMESGAQLATRDGRRTGNAYVDSIEHHDALGKLALVVTDMGNTFRMTIKELEDAFYPPEYVMRIEEARARRGVIKKEDCSKYNGGISKPWIGAEFLDKATFSAEEEAQAKAGICPHCHSHTLDPKYQGEGLNFSQCKKCNRIYVLMSGAK
jgi:hypothetical protein